MTNRHTDDPSRTPPGRGTDEALRESQSRLTLFFNQSVYGFYCSVMDEPLEWNERTDKEKVLDEIADRQRITEINDAMLAQYGACREELVGRPMSRFFPPDSKTGRQARRKLFDSGHIHLEALEARQDGTPVWIEGDYSCFYDGRSRIIGTFGIQVDISERKRKEAALLESQTHLQLALNAALMGTWNWDIQTNRVAWSPGHEALWGYAPGEFPGTYEGYESRLHPDDVAEARRVGQKALSQGINYEHECRVVWPDGTMRWVSSRGQPLYGSDGRPERMIGVVTDITNRKQAEQAIRESEERFRRLFENSLMGFYRTTPDGRILMANPALIRLLGYTCFDDLARLNLETEGFHPEYARRSFKEAIGRNGVVLGWESAWTRSDGTSVYVSESAQLIRDSDGRPLYYDGMVEDITHRHRMEAEKAKLQAQLIQAQKMESVGRLAGGVAHDFNNMLQVISGHTEMALEILPPESPLRENLLEIQSCTRRSADLTRQLLAFARKQTITPKILDLNETIESLLKMLRRLIGENIELAWRPGAGLWSVRMDPSQVDQILANLCVNSRDAIATVGRITLETKNCAMGPESGIAHPEFIPGEYVRLTVIDDGCGMTSETQANLFEPFFTTKETGKGTGLGLATVYGVVKQNHGFIYVDSNPGQGTAITIYLPRHAAPAVPALTFDPAAERGHETILLVEDEPMILSLTQRQIERLGYTVLAAGTPGEAFRLAREHPGVIHLLMTDVIMPEMNGRDLANSLATLHPDLRCLFMSGYTADVIAQHGVLASGVQFIQKPFSPAELATKIRETVGQKPYRA